MKPEKNIALVTRPVVAWVTSLGEIEDVRYVEEDVSQGFRCFPGEDVTVGPDEAVALLGLPAVYPTLELDLLADVLVSGLLVANMYGHYQVMK